MKGHNIKTRKSLDQMNRLQELWRNKKDTGPKPNGYEDRDHPSYNNTKL